MGVLVCTNPRVAKPPKAQRRQVTITLNDHFLSRLEALGEPVGRNRSEMIDRAIEEYVLRRESETRDQQQQHSPPPSPRTPQKR
jgi:hypothetical protein